MTDLDFQTKLEDALKLNTLMEVLRKLKFIGPYQGQEYVTSKGLLAVTHLLAEGGSLYQRSTLLQIGTADNGYKAIVKCHVKVITSKGSVFAADGLGDACAGTNGDGTGKGANVNRMIANAIERMSETRGNDRAMRFITNIHLTSRSELPTNAEAKKDSRPEEMEDDLPLKEAMEMIKEEINTQFKPSNNTTRKFVRGK